MTGARAHTHTPPSVKGGLINPLTQRNKEYVESEYMSEPRVPAPMRDAIFLNKNPLLTP